MDHNPRPAAPPWAHRPWCAPDCGWPPGGAEGTHLGRAWTLTPEDEETSQVALRLFEEPGENTPGVVRVLLSVTERRLPEDLDPFNEEPDPAIKPGLADITSSAGLTAQEAALVSEHLMAFAAGAPSTVGSPA